MEVAAWYDTITAFANFPEKPRLDWQNFVLINSRRYLKKRTRVRTCELP
ncbi:uncharacterized protein Asalp_19980 [Aeromonas salmonicida subsp. pectinolytica 34mel]|uniref:Uncharacterized protein n=1 Tax=Aeromonas salmonicida subsp. pectinolytica 34mel TaxID=1324960 RepID=A0A2D1QG32_AERSA|nr:hypothetical protein B224_1895 [Aeromonas media WS]ATP09197.1 uncharacterized protein Asalp_19980 [Aeromonas salmonicida subsp. pectinolytica 34mel]